MSRAPFFILVCVSIFVDATIATCTVSKNEIEYGERLACSNVTLSTALISGGPLVSNVIIFQSQIRNIPDRSFLKYNRTLVSLNLLNCSIRNISDGAFHGLRTLKKLGLSHNYITSVRDQWFFNLTSLEQLDLSHNLISTIEPTVFEKLQRLKRLDLSENRLTCLEPAQLVPMSGLEKLLFSGNPLTFRCRGTLTLWLRDLGINHKTDQREEENWLDNVLWLCAAEDGRIADSEVFMKECVVLNLFNQLRTGLTTAESFPLSTPQMCVDARNDLTKCIATERKTGREIVTNGHVIRKLLRHLEESKSIV